jgi:RNA polymerase I-specific transcription initiation factor RRN5
MELSYPEIFEDDFRIQHQDEDSGSAYEAPSSDVDLSSPEKFRGASRRTSRANSQKPRTRSTSREAREQSEDEEFSHGSEEDQRIREDALVWASKFNAPESAQDIKSPSRRTSKRKQEGSASEVRAKRLKGFYNNDYRELFNSEIRDAAARSITDDYDPLKTRQIGSSIWTPEEKDVFFSALSRLGRDNVRGIALRIGSKSEPEVQEYIYLLNENLKGKLRSQFGFTDIPAAYEISEECCDLLERAGDVLASRQELNEEQKEKTKWGDFWLLTSNVNKRIEERRKEEDGQQGIQDALPAANLFNLKNWLQLSRTIFMNPAEPVGGDNWQVLAEPGETPAIRATAFEDFHSLAVSITKRIVSTALFCAMSRQRATGRKAAHRGDVSKNDVEMALKILGLKINSNQFWISCARRNHLDIYEEDSDSDDEVVIAYDEVERELGKIDLRRSRSRSLGRHEHGTSINSVDPPTDIDDSSDSLFEDLPIDYDSISGQEDDLMSSSDLQDEELMDLSEGEMQSRRARQEEIRKRRLRGRKEQKRAQATYIEAFDKQENSMEEERLWTLLRQDPPFEIKLEPLEMLERSKNDMNDMDRTGWRQNMEYWSSWEKLRAPVPEENFITNRMRVSRRAKRLAREARSGRDLYAPRHRVRGDEENDEDGDGEDEEDQEEDEEEGMPSARGPKPEDAHAEATDDITPKVDQDEANQREEESREIPSVHEAEAELGINIAGDGYEDRGNIEANDAFEDSFSDDLSGIGHRSESPLSDDGFRTRRFNDSDDEGIIVKDEYEE